MAHSLNEAEKRIFKNSHYFEEGFKLPENFYPEEVWTLPEPT